MKEGCIINSLNSLLVLYLRWFRNKQTMDFGECEQGSLVVGDTSNESSSEFEKDFVLVIDNHGSETKMTTTTIDSSPLSCLDGDVENCTTSSVASCSDSGICSTPHNEEEIGFEDIPLNASDLCDGVDSSNFESSLSEKLSRMDGPGSCQLEGGKTGGKFRYGCYGVMTLFTSCRHYQY